MRDPQLQARLAEILEVELADDCLAWELDSGGRWHKVQTTAHRNSQERLKALAHKRVREKAVATS